MAGLPGVARGVPEGRRPAFGAAALALAALVGLGACGGPSETRLTLLGTTDVHGHLLPYDYATDRPQDHSLAQAVTLVDSIRRADPHVLLLDSGDLLQGTALNSYRAQQGAGEAQGTHPVIAAMNAAGYTAAAVGNHEFNYGLPYLEAVLADARFPFLAANVLREGTDTTAFLPYIVVKTGPVRVGVVGFTTPGSAIWDRENLQGRLRFEDIVESARRWVPRARQEADVVVVVAHSGLGPGSSYAEETGVPEENAIRRLATEVPGIDVIFAGHAHVPVAGERIGDALVLAAEHSARVLAAAHLRVVRREGRWRAEEAEGRLIPTRGLPPSPRIEEAVRGDHEAAVAWLREPIGYTPDHWSAARARFEDTPIADLIAEVQRRESGAELASTAIFDPGSSFGPGPITRRDVLGLYIYPNTLKAVRISGEDLREYLERSARYYHSFPAERLVNDSVPGFNYDMVSGAEYALDLRRPPGERVVLLRREGRAVLPTDSFTFALNNYRQSGGGGFQMVARAPLAFSTEREVSELLIEFIQRRDTLRHRDVFRENWRLLPPAAVAQLEREAAVRARR